MATEEHRKVQTYASNLMLSLLDGLPPLGWSWFFPLSNAHPPPHPPTTQAPTPQPPTTLPFFKSSSKHRAFSQRLSTVQTLACLALLLLHFQPQNQSTTASEKQRKSARHLPPLHPRTTYHVPTHTLPTQGHAREVREGPVAAFVTPSKSG